MDRVVVTSGGLILWECPGCNEMHSVWTDKNKPSPFKHSKMHSWDGSKVSPTIVGLIEVMVASYMTCQCRISNGHITFLDGCTHRFRDQVVPMLPWD